MVSTLSPSPIFIAQDKAPNRSYNTNFWDDKEKITRGSKININPFLIIDKTMGCTRERPNMKEKPIEFSLGKSSLIIINGYDKFKLTKKYYPL